MDFLADFQLVLVSGKGGVGKTTLSCGLARQLARQFSQETVLLLSTDPAHSLGDVLQMPVDNTPTNMPDLPNLRVRALNARALLNQFHNDYGEVLELLVERGSLVAGDDLGSVWDMGWPGLDELMALLEIQRILRDHEADRVIVDTAPSGHTLKLLSLMDFLDTLLTALEQFQEKHRYLTTAFSGRYTPDKADRFVQEMRADLDAGRALLQDASRTACWLVSIPEPMSWAESQRVVAALDHLQVPFGGLVLNRVELQAGQVTGNQHQVIEKFRQLAQSRPVLCAPLHLTEPLGSAALDRLVDQIKPIERLPGVHQLDVPVQWPAPIPPGCEDFVTAGRRLIIVGGKGGVGKTTVAAALSWALAERYPDAAVQVMSIDPAHSLGDVFGQTLGHTPSTLRPNLQAQEVDADVVLNQFRDEYLWELADIMSGDEGLGEGLRMAYGPAAWRQLVAQALPGIDEMLSLITVMDLLERDQQQLIVLDTAPTGHLLRFLEMPTALGDWLAWIFKLWIKYQDVVGRVEFMGRLRTLRQRVMAAQTKLKDAYHTEFIEVVQNQTAILAEAQRLTEALMDLGIAQRYVVHNRYVPGQELPANSFAGQSIIRLPALLPVAPFQQVQAAAALLFAEPVTGLDQGC